jgi:hypothetical protein
MTDLLKWASVPNFSTQKEAKLEQNNCIFMVSKWDVSLLLWQNRKTSAKVYLTAAQLDQTPPSMVILWRKKTFFLVAWWSSLVSRFDHCI